MESGVAGDRREDSKDGCQGRPVAATLRRFRRIAGSCAITKRGTARHFPHRVAWYHPAYDSYRVYGTCSKK
jgi:hypothetical protein